MRRPGGRSHYFVEGRCRKTTVRLHLPSESNSVDVNVKLTLSSSLHIGRNQIGNTFGGAFKEFDNSIVQPFQVFLRHVFRELYAFMPVYVPAYLCK